MYFFLKKNLYRYIFILARCRLYRFDGLRGSDYRAHRRPLVYSSVINEINYTHSLLL
jgi:hypothetical protein